MLEDRETHPFAAPPSNFRKNSNKKTNKEKIHQIIHTKNSKYLKNVSVYPESRAISKHSLKFTDIIFLDLFYRPVFI
jgi:hypothetical protein